MLSWIIFPADCDDVIARAKEVVESERHINLLQSNLILDKDHELDVTTQILENERAYHNTEMATLRLTLKEERIKKARSIIVAGSVGAGIMAVLIGIGKYLLR